MNTNTTIKRAALAAALLGLALGASSCNTSTAGLASSVLGQLNRPGTPLEGSGHPTLSGTVVGSDGSPLKGAPVWACDEGALVSFQKEFKPGKYRDKIPPSLVLSYKKGSQCTTLATSGEQGRFSKEFLPGQIRTMDLIIYRNDWKPLIIRGVTPPRDLGVIRLPGRDSEPHPNGITTREVK